MKRSILLFIVCCILSSLYAYDFEVNKIRYKILSQEKKTVEIELAKNTYSNDEIPSFIEYNNQKYTITSIGDYAFSYIPIFKIKIPDSVIKIGRGAFENSSSLDSVCFGKNIQTIGDDAFINCPKLTSVILGDSVKTIGSRAFSDCKKIVHLRLSKSLKTIKYKTFYNCINISSITIPDSVTTIESYAFYNCLYTKHLTLGSSLKIIRDNAFRDMCNIEGWVVMPASIESTESLCFANCGAKGFIFTSQNVPDIDIDSFNSAYNKITIIYVPEQFLQSYIDTWLYPRKKSGAQYTSTGLDGKKGYYGYLTCTCIIGYDNYDELINYITGIKNPSINNDNVKKDKVYKISGHIVNKPSKGINIINGNKVLIK